MHRRAELMEAQVIGVPNERYGEEIMAWVRLRPNSAIAEAELIAHCREHLAHFKTPRVWHFVEAFPMTVTGKVQKFRMREMALELLARPKN